ncbi:hypothetical protein JCM24511_02740 [Saitozyma sp. JCM 24511]|nr:hypothetical protein JCM24511_02740 [Saitozyma sp. JCM 24511]
MDEEQSFANLLSQSAAPSRPTWGDGASASDDPWANPFSDSGAGASNPFADTTSPFGLSSTYVTPIPTAPSPEIPKAEVSPYVAKLEEDDRAGRGTLPDPPSVIAAREQHFADADAVASSSSPPFTTMSIATGGYESPYASPAVGRDDPFAQPFAPTQYNEPSLPPLPPKEPAQAPPPAPSRKLPSDLIDEDLLNASDPSVSLKKAFVKSTPAQSGGATTARVGATPEKPKAYVFRPSGKRDSTGPPPKEGRSEEAGRKQDEVKVKQDEAKVEEKPAVQIQTTKDTSTSAAPATVPSGTEAAATKAQSAAPPTTAPTTDDAVVAAKSEDAPPHLAPPASIPLPESSAATPTASRPESPAPPSLPTAHPAAAPSEAPEPSPAAFAITPSTDRVAVSPLDTPSEPEYGFRNLSIGAVGAAVPPPVPEKTPLDGSSGGGAGGAEGWTTGVSSPPTSRFGGKGWGAMDEEEDGGLFGKGGPGIRTAGTTTTGDMWGTSAAGGWQEEEEEYVPPSAGPSQTSEPSVTSSVPTAVTAEPQTPSSPVNGTSRRIRTHPVFNVSVGDPTRIGDPVRGYTVYTVRTRTTSPHYRKGEFSVLRRFSDFLWLFEALTTNNPGIIVPPVPDKHPFGRFQDQFIETRRLALQRCLGKITSHPVLQLDPDLRMFLESDNFAMESKNRRPETPDKQGQGLLAGWTGPKYTEQDDWFDSRKVFLDSLESQLKALSKSIEGASKARLEMAISMGDFADGITALAESDLGSAMCAALARLADLSRREKETNEDQAKDEVVHLLNMADEYVRFIGSVRLAFASRIKAYHTWQGLEKEVVRLRQTREKLRQQGKLGDRVQSSLAEIVDVSGLTRRFHAERRARDASHEFDTISKLVKTEFARFERERVDEFKRVLQVHLDKQVGKQKELIGAWEEYHGHVLKMVQRAQVQA